VKTSSVKALISLTRTPKKWPNPRRRVSPVTMSLFGILNWVYMWFREGGPITREDYARIVTTLMLEGVKAIR